MAIANGTTYGYLTPNPFSVNAFVCLHAVRLSASQEVRNAA
ncbi:hypothetical protein SAMN05192562_101458 [Kosakonia arachidis]|uniref:Uncharacterized protein n=1 Tax=Kosakonia arachidis TaxID=551989 RepID=A0A1I6YDP2_9ENTR|nr:hypothetical protein SAMN05192562_101458 [Kosakonia arachidis]